MNRIEPESGFMVEPDAGGYYISSVMSDIQRLEVTSSNVLASGRRFGRRWFLKGVREELAADAAMRRRLMKEFEIHSRLTHPAIVQTAGFENIPALGGCIIEEWIEGKTLAELMRRGKLDKSYRRRIMREIISAVAYIHSRGVVHRDLKPSNIMIRDAGGGVVIVDFGLADTDDYMELKHAAGTPGFISPEQRKQGGTHTADDVYSLGVIMQNLCPDYAAIARKCVGPATKRPADAGELLKALDRRDRLPKIFAAVALTLFIVALAIVGGVRMHTLSNAAAGAQEQVAALTVENRRNAQLVTNLTDSLRNLSASAKNMERARQVAEEYNLAFNRARGEGFRRLDELISRYDRTVFSDLAPGDGEKFTPALTKLLHELADLTETFKSSGEVKTLTEADREKIREDMYNHYTITISEYNEKWIKKIFPAQQAAN